MTALEIRKRYANGERNFGRVVCRNGDFRESFLEGASFYMADLRGSVFDDSRLTHVQFKGANLKRASIRAAMINASDLIGADFRRADLSLSDMTGASLARANLRKADLRRASFGSADLNDTTLAGAKLRGLALGGTCLVDMDLTALIDEPELSLMGSCPVDVWSVMRSYRHPGLTRFMTDCGTPPLFAEYMISCAQATTEGAMRALMQSTFISYGGPDEKFARKLYGALRDHGIIVFFFPETAKYGERIDQEVFSQLKNYDRVILVCSKDSLGRPGVIHEIRETFDRESRDGAATYLLPITLDDYLFDGWAKAEPDLAQRVQRRVVGDFREAAKSDASFDAALRRLIDALKVARPTA